MEQFVDHLWQSACTVALVWVLAALLRDHPATLRLWLWRAAALKFLVPFSLLFALGAHIGFPVRHSAIAPPSAAVHAVDAVMPVAAPAQTYAISGLLLGAGIAFMSLLAAAALWLVARKLRQTRAQHAEEAARIEADWNSAPPPPGFLKTVALAGSVLVLFAGPTIGGALRDRQWRQQALAIDTQSLRAARITLTERSWRFGDRTEVSATAHGVAIRKINLQDLVALVYGIGEFEVFGGALPWLESPHYDVLVEGHVGEPAAFDPYSLREPVTNYLSQEFGVAIRVNGSCQEPCLNQQSFTVERLPWKILDNSAR
ncbi:MAG TPA: hypothetical protein VM146_11130 [Steroidobacteraceae bacterium]|nr:hypothetical protein [Steroidobacteraceae bacterium]